jgi:predicted deacylase
MNRFFGTALFLIVCCLLLASCKSTEKFTGFSYDPGDAANTHTKTMWPQHKRTVGISAANVWASNEFPEARLSDFYQTNDTLFRAVIKPGRAKIDNSPWYAFKIWAARDTVVWVQLAYQHGRHRYIPKLSRDKHHWHRIEPENYRVNPRKGTAFLHLHLTNKPLWVSAQELIDQQWFDQWADSLAHKPFITQDTVGYSHENRPIRRIKISAVPTGQKSGVLIITSRLHPPEVTGDLACFAFLKAVTADTKLGRHFRKNFEVYAYPFINIDGAQDGNWRNNAGGVDLNRDWKNFNQPETRAIRNDLLQHVKNNPDAKVYYGIDFHSTGANIFYPLKRNVKTFPYHFTYQWVQQIINDFPEIKFSVQPFDPSAPITKNWIYHTFGADAVTYEVSDGANRKKLKAVAKKAAKLIMKGLLHVKEKHDSL